MYITNFLFGIVLLLSLESLGQSCQDLFSGKVQSQFLGVETQPYSLESIGVLRDEIRKLEKEISDQERIIEVATTIEIEIDPPSKSKGKGKEFGSSENEWGYQGYLQAGPIFRRQKKNYLTIEDIQKVSQAETEIQRLNMEKGHIKSKLKTEEGLERQIVLRRIEEFESRDEMGKGIVSDYLFRDNMARLSKEYTLITLLFGESLKKATVEEYRFIEDLIESRERDPSALFVVDFDTKLGRMIHDRLPGRVLGVSALEDSPAKNIVKVRNAHIKLQGFLKGKEIFTNTSSAYGLALQFMATSFSDKVRVFDPSKTYVSPAGWSKQASGLGLGVREFNVEIITEVPKKFGILEKGNIKLLEWEGYKQKSLSEALLFERDISWQRVGLVENSQIFGAAIFGSGKDVREYGEFTYRVANALSKYDVDTVTGGAGGMMLAANMGGFHGGGRTVGIPIISGGRVFLPEEQRTFSEFHTKTLPANDYDTRVSFLIENRDYVINVPGGSGTMREIAATIIHQEDQIRRGRERPVELIFASPLNRYYQTLEDVFNAHELYRSRSDLVKFVGNPEYISERLLGKKVGREPFVFEQPSRIEVLHTYYDSLEVKSSLQSFWSKGGNSTGKKKQKRSRKRKSGRSRK